MGKYISKENILKRIRSWISFNLESKSFDLTLKISEVTMLSEKIVLIQKRKGIRSSSL